MIFRGSLALQTFFRGVVYPICSMDGIFTYTWTKFMANVSQHSSPMDPIRYANLATVGDAYPPEV